ncbi:hypothetical protein PAMP_021471 [Pampus punctatissimus]
MFITNQPGGKFTGLPGVTLNVTGNIFIGRLNKLMCHSSCRFPDRSSYIWYENGQKIETETSSSYSSYFYHKDSYSCAVKGHEDFVSLPVCVNDESCYKVIYTDRSICAFRGSSVDISCSYSSYGSITSSFWFSSDRRHQGQNPSQPEDLSKDSQYEGRVHVKTERGRSTLRISDLRESDSAQYHFTFRTKKFEWGSSLPGTTLTVTDLQVQVNTITVHQSYTEAELKCLSSCSPAGRISYVWFKNGQKVMKEETSLYSGQFNPGDNISCALRGHEDYRSAAVLVQGQNDYGVTYTSTQICAFKGSTVDIKCTYRYPSRVNDRDTTVDETLWFNKGSYNKPVNLRTESEYAGRVQYHCDKNDCTLRITDLRESDSAKYKFMFITNQPGGKFTGSPGVTLTVTGNIFIYYTRAELMCHSSCRFPDRSSYIWYKNGQKIETETSSSFSSNIYYTDSYSCAVKGHEDFVSLPVCARGKSCYRVNYNERSICAFRGSSVDISCSYSSYESIISSFWFSSDRRHQGQNPSQPEDLSKDSQYEGRVRVKTERGRSTLRISDLRESDSAQYHFTFRTTSFEWNSSLPGTTLTVTDLQVQVNTITVHQSYTEAELKCLSSCSPAGRISYVWFKNGQKVMKEETSLYSGQFNPGDNISCALRGHEDYRSAAVLVQGQNDYGVTYTSTQICAFKGSTVDINCTYRYPSRVNDCDTTVDETFWFNKRSYNEPVNLRTESEYAGRVQYHCDKNDCTLRITDLRESDSAEYKFRFITNQPGGKFTGSPGVTLTVTDTDLQVKVIRPTVYQYYTRAELKCHSSCRLPDRSSYIWYINGQKIETETSSSYSSYFYPPNSYSCAVKGHEDFVSLPVCARGKSCYRVNYNERSICAFRGSSVDISCSYSSYESIISSFWFSSDRRHQGQNPSQPEDLSKDSQYEGRVHVKTERRRSTLRISDLRESDSAQYHFTFITYNFEWGSSLPGTTLTVTDTDLQVKVIRSTVYQYYTRIELMCHSSCRFPDRSSYIWYKNGQPIKQRNIHFYPYPINPEDHYSCALSGYESFSSPLVYAPKLPSVSVSPSGDIMLNSSVTLTCSSDANPAANYTWYKKNVNPDLQPLSKEPQLVFSSIQSSDSGEYYCTAENRLGKRTSENIFIDVKYAPKLPSVSVSPSGEIVEGSSVNLTCSSDANPAANYTWYKNQKLLSGPEGSHHFISISSEDRGIYHCKSENQFGQSNSRNLSIDVQYAPKLPSVSVSPSGEIVEGSSVNLTCSSDANPAAKYTWYKENEESPKSSGQIFTITDVRPEHSGNYYCVSQNRRGRHNSTLYLTVVAGAWKLIVIGTTIAVLLAIIPLCVFLLIKSSTQRYTTKPNLDITTHIKVNLSLQRLPTQRQPGDQDDIHYASVMFSNNRADPIYSNIRAARPHICEEEGEVVEYTVVIFNSAAR